MWRKHETHKEETKAVKNALQSAGIQARVGHGTGTAWSWLHIKVKDRNLEQEALRIAQEVTGRSGEYSGEINTSYEVNS